MADDDPFRPEKTLRTKDLNRSRLAGDAKESQNPYIAA